ncbi:hypothetical protein BV898_06758 [Hypsibius exemplaris]|uniref:Uncharacterized protein n=1 Tax=Hypsibius exemplaris TaxID=2072580 RepID=A0A1W0WV79_HYPEX|nr:hypothetical protein BV898_06758 [Hypsibius exemplaris]
MLLDDLEGLHEQVLKDDSQRRKDAGSVVGRAILSSFEGTWVGTAVLRRLKQSLVLAYKIPLGESLFEPFIPITTAFCCCS